ncbi:methyltransferase domain-containing protein [Mesorhizobium sp. KR9-304]|uniref:class I SAM-dependent methyltransferase n=1 Tax=Mesorhizobium sp. KR9-304 TaxID=3156614 RepID=UPI0032B3AC39
MSEAANQSSRHDAWQAGDAYEGYMGRWSRRIAPQFLDLLALPRELHWLEIGCGTGALSAAILARSDPESLIAIDPSEGFLAKARASITDQRADFRQGDAQAIDVETASRDAAVSALTLNFVPDRAKALSEMKRVTRAGGTVAFYVWDYPGGGLEFLRTFWTNAEALDPKGVELAEVRRFPFCTPERLTVLATEAGLSDVTCEAVVTPTVFSDFDDYWRPFTQGAGPAPGYVASLAPQARERLRERLEASLPREADGSIALQARAWAVRSKVA